jgi:hypothetical protein
MTTTVSSHKRWTDKEGHVTCFVKTTQVMSRS